MKKETLSRTIIPSSNLSTLPSTNAITLLIDGSYLIKKSFLGADSLNNSQGTHIGALYQFIMTTRKIIKEVNANKCVVFFDGDNSGKYRHSIYESYKANRTTKDWYNKITLNDKELLLEEAKQKSLLSQKVKIQNYLENLFIRQIECEYIESDDLIAQYCKNYYMDEKIHIFTNDRDLCQLIEYDNVSIYLDNKKKSFNKDNYFLLFKHSYKNLKLLKTICGDSSDNIKGIKGCGETILLKHFPELNDNITYDFNYIIDKAKQINEDRLKNKQKPLSFLDNIVNGIFSSDLKVKSAISQFKIYDEIIDLLKPILNHEAIHELKIISEYPLDIENRTSKNLLEMMNKDKFFENYNGSLSSFTEPFHPLIMKEKQFYKENNN